MFRQSIGAVRKCVLLRQIPSRGEVSSRRTERVLGLGCNDGRRDWIERRESFCCFHVFPSPGGVSSGSDESKYQVRAESTN